MTMRIKTIHREREDKKYPLPDGSYDVLINANGTYLLDSEYEIRDGFINILSKEAIGGDVVVSCLNDKSKVIGFTDAHIFKYSDNKGALRASSSYLISANLFVKERVHAGVRVVAEDGDPLTDDESYVYVSTNEPAELSFDTRFSPMYCLKRDVLKLIGKTIADEIAVDIDRYIFDSSVEIKEEYEEEVDKKSPLFLKKLSSNMVALDIVYQFYYKLVEGAGTEEDKVGTLMTKKVRLEAKLESLIKRFKDNIDEVKAEDGEDVSDTSRSFKKGSRATSPVGGRLW